MKIFQVITVSEYGGAQTIVADLVKKFSSEHELFLLYGGNGCLLYTSPSPRD